MSKTLLVLDVHYLCYRAFYSTGGLAYGGKPTGVIYGFLKTVAQLKDEFQTDNVAFCFEHPTLHRRKDFPEYKLKRHLNKKPEEIAAHRKLAEQIKLLREKYLHQIGFNNVFCQPGYESDDLMAAIAQNTPDGHETILITADSDLLQCIAQNVCVYSPHTRKLWTWEGFVSNYGIRPSQWAVVKAIGGCNSDGVPGVERIGEATALKYVQKALSETSAAFKRIRDNWKVVQFNRRLVQLPYQHCITPTLQEDNITKAGWRVVCEELGFKSMIGHPPVYRKTL